MNDETIEPKLCPPQKRHKWKFKQCWGHVDTIVCERCGQTRVRICNRNVKQGNDCPTTPDDDATIESAPVSRPGHKPQVPRRGGAAGAGVRFVDGLCFGDAEGETMLQVMIDGEVKSIPYADGIHIFGDTKVQVDGSSVTVGNDTFEVFTDEDYDEDSDTYPVNF